LCLLFSNLLSQNVALAEDGNSNKHLYADQKISITATKQPVTIDGKLDDVSWQQAKVINQFHQVLPDEYQPFTAASQVFILYDQEYLYIGAKLFDNDMAGVQGNAIAPGLSINSDDNFSVILDPYNSKTNGYYFGTNINALKEEALTSNNNRKVSDWQGIWHVKTSVNTDHWVVEMAIPFKTLSFSKDNEQWGINFIRELKEPQQTLAWASHGETIYPWAAEHAGTLLGLKVKGDNAITQGMGLDVTLSASANNHRDFVTGQTEQETAPSLDVFYKPTSSITTALTINTDFSATEVDQQQVNLTRFSLFLPEKRDFFLQGADMFDFGQLSGNGQAFFSRNIGLSEEGAPLDINVGAKVTGRENSLAFALLAISQKQMNEGNQKFAVARASYEVNDEFTAGFIGTSGSPNINESNNVLGFDFLYRKKSFWQDNTFEMSGWFQTSDTRKDSYNANENNALNDNSDALGLTLRLPNSKVNAELAYKEIQENFNPALGFVNRAGVKEYKAWLSVKNDVKPDWASWLYHSVMLKKTTDIDNNTLSKRYDFTLFEILSEKENFLSCELSTRYEYIEKSFELLPELIVPAGEHDFTKSSCSVQASYAYPVSGYFVWSKGDYFQGTSDAKHYALWSNLHPKLRVELNYTDNKIVLDHHQFNLRQISAKIDIAFHSQLFWNNWFQYNNVSETLGLFSRIRWQYNALSQLDVVVNRQFLEPENWRSMQQDLAAKLSYTYRF
jgi:hypothetical protein